MVNAESMTKKRKMITEPEAKNKPFSNLPFDLTSLIMSHLSMKDNMRASSVCKTWHEACVSVRFKDPIPWLLHFPPDRETYELYDPSLAKTYIHKLSSELRNSCILHSSDGWLLIKNFIQRKTFFFNPFTHDIIQMPCSEYNEDHRYKIAFSCAPTSNSCVIFAICNNNFKTDQSQYFTIKTCHVSTKVCTSFTVPKKLPRKYNGFKQIVFSNGVFYCLANKGISGMFDLSTSTWDVLPPLRKGLRSDKGFLAEYQGDIFLIYACKKNELRTYLKLDLIKQEWTEDKKISLAGFSFYLSFKSSLIVMSTQRKQQIHLHNVWIRPPVKCSHLKG